MKPKSRSPGGRSRRQQSRRRWRRWTPAEVEAVDWTADDAVIERRFGVARAADLRRYLRRRGYAIPRKPGSGRHCGRGRRSVREWLGAGLGRLPDGVVARGLGVSRQAVAKARTRLSGKI